jgi:hypothetical protein
VKSLQKNDGKPVWLEKIAVGNAHPCTPKWLTIGKMTDVEHRP